MPEASKPIRAFIAINLPGTLKEAIAEVQRELKLCPGGQAIRWIPQSQIHLTLRFLGDVPVPEIEAIGRALNRATAGINPFQMSVAGVGCFPHARQPRIVWLGIEETTTTLEQLQQAINQETMAWGQIDSRPFTPHLTLGRIKREHARDARRLTESLPAKTALKLGHCQVTQVDLMQSTLTSVGPEYSQVAHSLLGKR